MLDFFSCFPWFPWLKCLEIFTTVLIFGNYDGDNWYKCRNLQVCAFFDKPGGGVVFLHFAAQHVLLPFPRGPIKPGKRGYLPTQDVIVPESLCPELCKCNQGLCGEDCEAKCRQGKGK